MGITPKLIITGPGEYVTRDGRKATVEGSRIDVCGGVRFMDDVSGNVIGWDEYGLFCAPGHHPCDIIGPWTEDTKAEEPEMWTAVYRNGKQLWMGGRKENSAEKVHQSNTQTANYCGALKLVKGE